MRNSSLIGWVRTTFIAAVAVVGLSGCASNGVDYDPLEPLNRAIFGLNDGLDKAIGEPLAKGYVAVTPAPIRQNIYSFFDNLAYPNTILNDFLQGKFTQGIEDTGRFLVNTIFGFGGIADVATGMGLERHEEDFGQTLAVWGFGEGIHLELPLFGPKSLRDVPDLAIKSAISPLDAAGASQAQQLAAQGGDLIDTRARLAPAIKTRNEALDPYVFQREAYRQRRRFLIYDGNPPVE